MKNSNRIIKFRAWDKKKEMMMMVGGITFNTDGDFDGGLIVDDENWIQIKEFELMQYTGLKDKNGKEIYESDVVNREGKDKLPFEVKIPRIYFPTCDFGELEVIGNIYENPELLK